MAKLVIRNTHPNLDGVYEFDPVAGFNKTEWYLMKKHVGVVVDDMMPGKPVDMNVMTAWGLVVLHRAGKDHLFPAYMNTNDDQAKWEFDEDEVADESVPTLSGSGESGTPPELSEPSGPSTNGGSDVRLEIIPLATGSPPSATTVTSDPETSET